MFATDFLKLTNDVILLLLILPEPPFIIKVRDNLGGELNVIPDNLLVTGETRYSTDSRFKQSIFIINKWTNISERNGGVLPTHEIPVNYWSELTILKPDIVEVETDFFYLYVSLEGDPASPKPAPVRCRVSYSCAQKSIVPKRFKFHLQNLPKTIL